MSKVFNHSETIEFLVGSDSSQKDMELVGDVPMGM